MSAIFKNFALDPNSETERLYSLPFKECAEAIQAMDSTKKASIVSQIQPTLDSLYEYANRFDDDRWELKFRPTPEEYMFIMGKIKRWETLLYWLYEIDIQMGETELDRLITETETRLAQHGYSKDAVKYKTVDMINPETNEPVLTKRGNVKKERVAVNLRDHLDDLYKEKWNRVANTDMIIAEAKELAAKYYCQG